MRSGFLLRLLFVLYCVEVGAFLFLWPWMSSYDRVWLGVDWETVRNAAQSGAARSLLSAFGALHLVWALHDLDLMLRRENREGS